MERITRISVVMALAALAVGAGTAGATTSVDRDPDVTSPGVQARIDRGDEFVAQRRYSAARDAYGRAAELQRDSGRLPAHAMRRIANAYYYEGRLKSAARTLDELADEAASFGDLRVQAWALADAAWLYGRAGAGLEVSRRLARLERLLTSPYMPDSVRLRITEFRLDGGAVMTLR
jgi:tetratricopeptide (TPR) repeat protein